MPSGHVDKTKLRPLTPHAESVLKGMARNGPVARYLVNPGVVDRLTREGLIEQIQANGKPFLRATEAGRAATERRS